MIKNYNDIIGLEYITQKVYKTPIWSEDFDKAEYNQKSGFITKISLNENGKPSLIFCSDGSNFLPEYIEVYFNQKEVCKVSEWHEKSNQVPLYFLKDTYVYTINSLAKTTKYKVEDVIYYGENGVIKCKEVRVDDILKPTLNSYGFDQVYIYDELKEQYYSVKHLQDKIKKGDIHV